MKTAFSYLAVVGMPVVTFFGVVMGNEYAMNITTFMCWLTAALVTICLPAFFLDAEEQRRIRKKIAAAKVVPRNLDYACDIIALVLFVIYGKFLLAGLWAYQLIAFISLNEGPGEEDSDA